MHEISIEQLHRNKSLPIIIIIAVNALCYPLKQKRDIFKDPICAVEY